MRTPLAGENGRNPELVIPDAFTDLEQHLVIISFASQALTIFFDEPEQGYVFTPIPEALMFWAFPSVGVQQLRLTSNYALVFNIWFYGLILAPAALLLAVYLDERRETRDDG